jgi:hypothetical protein
VVALRFNIARRDTTERLLVGRFHQKDVAHRHAAAVRRSVERLEWIRDVRVDVETIWHLRSGRAAAQLVHDIFGHAPCIEPSREVVRP